MACLPSRTVSTLDAKAEEDTHPFARDLVEMAAEGRTKGEGLGESPIWSSELPWGDIRLQGQQRVPIFVFN